MNCKKCGNKSHSDFCFRCKPRKPIANRSKKRLAQESEYSKLRKVFLTIHNKCEVNGCSKEATDIHHVIGRIGDRLTDQDNFLAVCREHHRYIEEHPEWAKANGYSKNRL